MVELKSTISKTNVMDNSMQTFIIYLCKFTNTEFMSRSTHGLLCKTLAIQTFYQSHMYKQLLLMNTYGQITRLVQLQLSVVFLHCTDLKSIFMQQICVQKRLIFKSAVSIYSKSAGAHNCCLVSSSLSAVLGKFLTKTNYSHIIIK